MGGFKGLSLVTDSQHLTDLPAGKFSTVPKTKTFPSSFSGVVLN